MKSSFFEFHVASTALFTARGNLQVISHNVANVDTPGYSRQYAMQRANTPIALYNGKGMVGTGSEVYGVGQIRDFYLDKKYWSEMGVLGEFNVKKIELEIIESVFNDVRAGGLTDAFNDFFTKLQSLTENAGNSTYRTNLIQSANSLIGLVQLQAKALQKQQQDINTEVKAIVDRISSLGQQIGSLNKQIKTLEVDGSTACDLRDERARLVDELSRYVNIEVTEREMNDDYAAGKYPDDPSKSDKRFVVKINGYELVNHFTVNSLECIPREPGEENNEMDVPGLYDIYFTNGAKFNIYSTTLKGELRGLIDMRDGNNDYTTINGNRYNTTYKGIPHYMDRLNDLVRTFAKAINHGLGRDNTPIPGVIGHVIGTTRDNMTGYLFFSRLNNDGTADEMALVSLGNDPDDYYNQFNVFNITLNPAIVRDPVKIGAAYSIDFIWLVQNADFIYRRAQGDYDSFAGSANGISARLGRLQTSYDDNPTAGAIRTYTNNALTSLGLINIPTTINAATASAALGAMNTAVTNANNAVASLTQARDAAKSARDEAEAIYRSVTDDIASFLKEADNVISLYDATLEALNGAAFRDAFNSAADDPPGTKDRLEDAIDDAQSARDAIASARDAIDVDDIQALITAAELLRNTANNIYSQAQIALSAAENTRNAIEDARSAVSLAASDTTNNANLTAAQNAITNLINNTVPNLENRIDDLNDTVISANTDNAISGVADAFDELQTPLGALMNALTDELDTASATPTTLEELQDTVILLGLSPRGDESDNRTLLSLLAVKDYAGLFKEGKLSDFINVIATEIGIDIKQATKFESNYTDVTTAVNNQRLSISGVNINEEMINMIKHQQLYQAAAKLINIIDGIYATLCNRLGAF